MSTPDRINVLASGRRFCSCENVKLVVSEWELQNTIPYSSDNFKNLAMEVMHGIRYGKPTKGFQACCNQCDKIYLATKGVRSRKELLRQIQQSRMEQDELAATARPYPTSEGSLTCAQSSR